jgi:UDP-glucose 4-epimerase
MTTKKQITSLVTGGAGFIGSHVVDNLIHMGHKVIVLDDLSGGFKENVNEKAELIVGSITKQSLLSQLFNRYNFNYVYHIAAYAAEGLSHFIRHFNYENNLVGSINLINQSVKHNINRFIFTSSIAVYGSNQTPMVETLTPHPEDPYGISKYAIELDLKAAHELFGLNYTIFRPHNVYGERQNLSDPYRNVLGIFINNMMKGKPMTIFGDGKQTRAFTHIDDVAPHIANSINVSGTRNQIFNIGSDTPYSVLELAEIISESMNVPAKVKHLPARNEVTHAFSDHSKFKKTFNVKQTTDLKEGIKKMIQWSHDIGPQQPTEFRHPIEITKNLPPSWSSLLEKNG